MPGPLAESSMLRKPVCRPTNHHATDEFPSQDSLAGRRACRGRPDTGWCGCRHVIKWSGRGVAMSSTESPLGPVTPRRRILWLVVVHIVVGLMGAFVTYSSASRSLRGAAFFGIVFSQTSLLGIWGGLGSSAWWRRLIGVVAGVGYLTTLLGVGVLQLSRVTFLIVAVATASVAMPLLIIHFFKVAIHLDTFPGASAGRIQFSIRHLMILTFAVACLITIGKWVQSDFSDGEKFFQYLLCAATFGVVGILPVWSNLASKSPVSYSGGLVAVGTCAGYPRQPSASARNHSAAVPFCVLRGVVLGDGEVNRQAHHGTFPAENRGITVHRFVLDSLTGLGKIFRGCGSK